MLALPFLAAVAAAADTAISIPFERYELENGLTVILSEDHSIPYVWVNIWYRVGSKDEVAGRTGFAHLFEHLMFQGSAHANQDYFVPLQAVGGVVNGTTSFDRTNYFEGVPAEHLPLALWLESDRMGWLLEALDQARLDNQKEVVRNERRQNYENRPYGEVWIWLLEAMYPEGHPYRTPTIGRHEDIEAATLDEVRAFFRTWYAPSNASLVICGDFDPAEARRLVRGWFGGVPAKPDPARAGAEPWVPPDEKVVRRTDDVPHDKVWIAWSTPPLFAPGDADLDILSSVLADGKESRLYSRLVYDRQIAKEISAHQGSQSLGSLYVIEATAAAGHSTDEIVAEVDRVLDELRAAGPTAGEVEVARTGWLVNFYAGLQTIQGKANQLNSYFVTAGDPGFIGRDLQRYLDVTPASVQGAAAEWLPPGRRVVLHVSPERKP